ncbi:hypothetical protein PVK06_035165 [Gossypium arboreum]|uniref:Retrotransposon gag domain-containing protein n=1 Tax=Gossypium arboreum TaxID=29729 RepID=A0ABR0NG48_GOSAR|nr:hypothetical protein PVK06_035165 [Gossypium arboreum]
MGQRAKPVTMAQNAPYGGLSIRWGSFSPRELVRFKELLEKPIRLKPGEFGRTDHLRPHGSQDERSSPVTSGIQAISSKALLGCRKKLLLREQLREFVWDTIGSSENKLAGKDNAFEAMVTALKEEINDLKGELKIFKAAIGNGMLASNPKQQAMDMPKSKVFKGATSASEVDNFLWAMEQYFGEMNIKDVPTKANTISMYFTDVALLWWRHKSTNVRRGETEIGTWKDFQKEFKAQFYPEYAEDKARVKLQWLTLKPWVKQELQHQGVQELTNTMMVAESIVELVPRRDKFESSKPNRRGNGEYYGEDEEGYSYYGNGSSSDGGRRGPFKVHKQKGQGTVGNTKPRCENQGDSKGNKSKLGQVRAETSCQRDVPTSVTIQVKR